MWGV
jgi:hypothetical protein